MKKRRSLLNKSLGCLLLAILTLGLQPSLQSGAIPPSIVPPDGHDPAAVLATGTVRAVGTAAEGDLLNTVFQFHKNLNDEGLHTSVSADICLACHNDIYTKETIRRKMPNEDGTIEVVDDINQHAKHLAKAVLNYEEQCTFCHIEFATTQEENQITIAGYVEKTTCAGCHSRFSPRGLMFREYYETQDGCPGCHTDVWEAPHSESPIYASIFVMEAAGFIPTIENCLICHGDSKYHIPEFLQDLFWLVRRSL